MKCVKGRRIAILDRISTCTSLATLSEDGSFADSMKEDARGHRVRYLITACFAGKHVPIITPKSPPDGVDYWIFRPCLDHVEYARYPWCRVGGYVVRRSAQKRTTNGLKSYHVPDYQTRAAHSVKSVCFRLSSHFLYALKDNNSPIGNFPRESCRGRSEVPLEYVAPNEGTEQTDLIAAIFFLRSKCDFSTNGETSRPRFFRKSQGTENGNSLVIGLGVSK